MDELINERQKKYTTGECEQITGISMRIIRELCRNQKIISEKIAGEYSVDIDSLKKWQKEHKNYKQPIKFLGDASLAFGDLELDFNTQFKPILSKNKNDEIFDTDKYEYQLQYWIANTGKVFDCDTGIYLKPSIKNGYYYVNLKKGEYQYQHTYIHISTHIYSYFSRLLFL